MFKKLRQRGQVLVFFALMLPTLFLFVGITADLGWMYLNLYRLQNAADAAVTAGAKNLIKDEKNLSDYSYSTFVANSDEGLKRLMNNEPPIISSRDTKDGDKVAKEYAAKNLAVDGKLKNDEITDGWNNDALVTFNKILYGVDAEDYKSLYYTITLSEEIGHLFTIMDRFDKWNVSAMAVAHITHNLHGLSLNKQMELLRNDENYATWDHIKNEYDKMQAKDYAYLGVGTNTMNAARARSVQAKGNEYISGNVYRTETLTLHGWSIATTGYGSTSGNKMDQRNLDNLFVDFKVDISKNFKVDEDIGTGNLISNATYDSGYNLMPGGVKANGDYNSNYKYSSWTDEEKDALKFRIHDLVNIGRWDGSKYVWPYEVREGKEPPDPLYVYIESENNYSHEHQNTTAFNTVRQIIINVNASNYDTEDEDSATKRPLFLFYDGPEKIDGKYVSNKVATWYEDWRFSWKYPSRYANNPRNSLPVILNLNADFRGVLYMPNSPVVVNGNGHKFKGFVVALKFLTLKTADDFPEEAHGGTKKIDSNGNVLYVTNDEEGTETVLYTYTKITQEKSNLLKTFVGYEKEYVELNPMFVDAYGNVQYNEDKIAPTIEIDSVTHADDINLLANYKLFKKEDFNLSSSTFNGFEKVSFKNYTYLKPGVTDNFFETERATHVD